MMFRFDTLTLSFRQSREVIRFSPQVSFFHGPISSGKSSVARMINFCLGGKLEVTPAIHHEFISAQLAGCIGQSKVLLERELGSNQVHVTWRDSEGEPMSALAPLKATPDSPILGTEVYNLSDLIFHLQGITPIRIRRGERARGTGTVRLSFRDLMWYCYLRQDLIDSSFFRLDSPVLSTKSRYAMRFVVGDYTERLSQIETELDSLRTEKAARIQSVREIREFLSELGFGTEQEFEQQISAAKEDLTGVREARERYREEEMPATHIVDELRQNLRELSNTLGAESRALNDLEERLREQRVLRSELVSAQFKIARSEVASNVLPGVAFEICPSCGNELDHTYSSDRCHLCGRGVEHGASLEAARTELARRDLRSRIDEVSDSIERHEASWALQRRRLEKFQAEKRELDRRLTEELRAYDSATTSRVREYERRIAILEEKINGLERMNRMPTAVARLEEESDQMSASIEKLSREIEQEMSKLDSADAYVEEIEEAFLKGLLAVGVPGVSENDKIEIDRTTWIAHVLSNGEHAFRWDFSNAGSAGKKTLFNACYALAVHLVASRRGLPLPSFIIIDTPMKNISEDVNRDIFVAFYKHLYQLAANELSETQFILIDGEYISPDIPGLEGFERRMTLDDPDHPPLISYYRGA